MEWANEASSPTTVLGDDGLGAGEDVTWVSITGLDVTPQHRIQQRLKVAADSGGGTIFGFDDLEATFVDTEGNTVAIGDSPCRIEFRAYGQNAPTGGDGGVQDDGIDVRMKVYEGTIRDFDQIKLNV